MNLRVRYRHFINGIFLARFWQSILSESGYDGISGKLRAASIIEAAFSFDKFRRV